MFIRSEWNRATYKAITTDLCRLARLNIGTDSYKKCAPSIAKQA